LLLRHGKSDWHAGHGCDHERPLADRGVKAARRVGIFLQETGRVPDLVMTSTAKRARKTVDLAAEAGGWTCPIMTDRSLYGTDSFQVLDTVCRLPEDATTVMLAGHEPTSSALLGLLIGGGQVRFPTAAVAAIGLEVEHWTQVQQGCGELLWMIIPALLKS
jgi:phosphohistidine phosphatase